LRHSRSPARYDCRVNVDHAPRFLHADELYEVVVHFTKFRMRDWLAADAALVFLLWRS
jgi:hypothetical protein